MIVKPRVPSGDRHHVAVEEPLSGGNTHGSVAKVGPTVRRPTGPWTPGVHALLRHLEMRRFEGAPRVLGTDDQGREILTYVDGLVVWPDHFDLVAPDSSLAQIAHCIRVYHDAVANFPSPDDYEWSDRGSDPVGPPEVLCHNDLAPWNLVRGPDDEWTFIDWDLAAPGRRSWDLAWALLSFVPLMPGSGITDRDIRRRVGVFRDAYGTALFPSDVIAVAIERCGRETRLIRDLGARGELPYSRLLAEGHSEIWAAAAEHIARHALGWQSPSDT